MTNKEKELLKLVREYVAKWQPLLGLDMYTIYTRVEPDSHEDYAMSVVCNHEGYLDAVIDINPAILKSPETVANLEHAVIHELAHIIIDPMSWVIMREFDQERSVVYKEFEKQEERVCDFLAMLIRRINASTK